MFSASTYVNFVSALSAAQERLFLQYIGPRDDFDIIVVGSGVGGGVLADALAEKLGETNRILLLEAGSFVYPTHVYNMCRFPNSSLARHFGCDTFWQSGNPGTAHFIGEKPQLNLGGRSIFWSGLIPTIQPWELEFFPPTVRQDLQGGLLEAAGETVNESRSMGTTAHAVVEKLRQSALAQDFSIHQTPRALHQPYLTAKGVPASEFSIEPTGVFNTAELLINQVGLTPGAQHGDGPGLHLLLNHFVEDLRRRGDGYELVCRNTVTSAARMFAAPTVVLAGGSIETPKLMRRSSMFEQLPSSVRELVGRGLTDHPTTDEMVTFVTGIGDVPVPKTTHAKIIFYSRGLRDGDRIRFPFNVEMNINHEYWHLRENDPNDPNRNKPGAFSTSDPRGPSRVDIKFSFGNCLDDDNEIKPAPPFEYVPEIRFGNLNHVDRLKDSRLPALAGWHMGSANDIFDLLNDVADRIFSQFEIDGVSARPHNGARYGKDGKGFGWGTVHHATGTMRMPYRAAHDRPFAPSSVVDEDLQVVGAERLHVCDMSVMPFSSAANPVRTLVALALRLAKKLG
jgi:hypothetical protein